MTTSAHVRIETETFDPPLDPGIESVVFALRSQGVDTFESCEGGLGHAYDRPTVRFHFGDETLGLRAARFLTRCGYRVVQLPKLWQRESDGASLAGPYWEILLARPKSRR